jgi:hypothetical protein
LLSFDFRENVETEREEVELTDAELKTPRRPDTDSVKSGLELAFRFRLLDGPGFGDLEL